MEQAERDELLQLLGEKELQLRQARTKVIQAVAVIEQLRARVAELEAQVIQ